jgi:hypothetical protein
VAKKNFSKGFSDLLEGAMDGNLAERVTQKMASKQSPSKSFAADLESLFESSIKESTMESLEAIKDGKKTPVSKARTKPAFGLDALIRETVETSTVETSQTPEGLKRVTITIDQKRLDKLKKIARIEKSYLKDIINEVVAEYIAKYEIQQNVI